jgi:hypothetical protein
LIAQFFVDWLREQYGADFNVENELSQDSHVDVYAYSATAAFDDLKIQNVTAGSRVQTAPEIPWPNSIREAIMRKDEKFPADVKQELTLVIEGAHPIPDIVRLEDHLEFGDCFDFRGIYLVMPDGTINSERGDTEKGFVYTIKNAFGPVNERVS